MSDITIPRNGVSISVPNRANTTIPTTITQTERLFTTRSRSIYYQDKGGDRGQRAFVKILTTDPEASRKRTGEGVDTVPTSIGNGKSTVLEDAIDGNGYASFLLTDVQCSFDEKLQVVETFGDAEVSYYFGRQPIMFQFSGVLIDSPDNNWFIEWVEMYSHVMRGSQLARNYELIKLVLPNMTLVGTISRMGWSQNSSRDVDIPFQFSFLAKQVIPTPVEIPGKPLTNLPVIDWSKASGFLDKAGQNAIKIKSLADKEQELRDVISNPVSTVKDYADAMNGLGSGISGAINHSSAILKGATGSVREETNGFMSSISNLFGGISANLSGIRASLFSPIYGVLNSLTKLIKNVTGGYNAISSLFTGPLRDILRDVRNISNMAIGVVNAVTNSINNVTNEINRTNNDILATVALLKKTRGVITSAPESIDKALRRLVAAGKLPLTAGFLKSRDVKKLPNGNVTGSKVALLSSGKRHTAESGAKL